MNIRETRACLSAIYQGLSGAADCWSDLKNDGVDTMLRVIDERETMLALLQKIAASEFYVSKVSTLRGELDSIIANSLKG